MNVGDNNKLDGVATVLNVTGVQTLNLNDQNAVRRQTYVVTNEAIGRPGSPPQVLIEYHQTGTVQINVGKQAGSQLVDDTFDLFLPT